MKIAALWRKPRGSVSAVGNASFIAGGALLLWSGYIHFHLWDTEGYRHIPIIGPLFILQAISALILGLAAMATRRLLSAILGLGFALGTISGFLISVTGGIFGFQDSWLAPDAQTAFFVEVTAVLFLLAGAALCISGDSTRGGSARLNDRTNALDGPCVVQSVNRL
jgi:hypothetical protein